jgi:hypothetical protein
MLTVQKNLLDGSNGKKKLPVGPKKLIGIEFLLQFIQTRAAGVHPGILTIDIGLRMSSLEVSDLIGTNHH